MYSISPAALDYLKAGGRCDIEVTAELLDVAGQKIITDANIINLNVDRYTSVGERIDIGSTCSAELTIVLDNFENQGKFTDGALFANTRFEGAVLRPYALVPVSPVQRVPLGVFIVDTPPRKLTTITLIALDYMARFHRPFQPQAFPRTISTLLSTMCSQVGITLRTVASSLTNYSYNIPAAPEMENLTCLQVLQWITELTGTCAWFDWDGQLNLTWYASTTTQITSADRYVSDIHEQNITISGVQIVANDENRTVYSSGATGYRFSIEGNLLAQSNLQAIVNALGTKLNNFTYRPYSCETNAWPHVWPMDMIAFVDSSNTSRTSIVSFHNITVNGRSKLAGKGETKQVGGYAALAPLTAQQRMTVEDVARRAAEFDDADLWNSINATNNGLTAMQAATLELNSMVANSLGLYFTAVPQPDGSSIYYWHAGTTLAGSTGQYVERKNAGGWAWTNNYQGTTTVWQYGITRDGNAVFRTLTAYKLSADLITTGLLQGPSGTFSLNMVTGAIIMNSAQLTNATVSGTFQTAAPNNRRIEVNAGGTYPWVNFRGSDNYGNMQVYVSYPSSGSPVSRIDSYGTFELLSTLGNISFWSALNGGKISFQTGGTQSERAWVDGNGLNANENVNSPSVNATNLTLRGYYPGVSTRAVISQGYTTWGSIPVGEVDIKTADTTPFTMLRVRMLSNTAQFGGSLSFQHQTSTGTYYDTKLLEFISDGRLLWDGKEVATIPTSTEKTKTDIYPYDDEALAVVNASKIYSFRYKDKEGKPKGKTKYGLVIERECPSAVVEDSGEAISIYSMNSILWKAVQELSEKVDKLQNELTELRNKVEV